MIKQLLAVAGDEAANFMLLLVYKLFLVVSGTWLTAIALPCTHFLLEMKENFKVLAKVTFLVYIF